MRSVARLVSSLVALALLVAGVVTVIEVVGAAFGADPLLVPRDGWADDGRTTTWDDAGVRLVFLVVGIVGLALLVVVFSRRRPTRIPMSATAGLTALTVRRRSLERSLQQAASGVDGIGQASVRIDRSKVRIKAAANHRDTAGLDAAVAQAVTDRLVHIGVDPPPSVRVTTTARAGRA